MPAFSTEKPAIRVARMIEVVENICFRLSCLSVFSMMLLVSADAVARYGLDSPIAGVYGITEDYLMVALVFLGASSAYAKGAFVRVTSFIGLFPDKLRRLLQLLATVATLAVFTAIVVGGWDTAARALKIGEFSSNILSYPLAPAYFIVVIGSTLLCARLIQALFVPAGGTAVTDDSEGSHTC